MSSSPASTPDLTQLLSQVERRVTRHLASSLKSAGRTVEQWRVLMMLSDGTGHTMTDIADFALVPAPTLTKLVDQMVADNLVYRRVDHRDRRRVLVFLSARGKSHYSSLKRQVDERHAALLAGIDGVSELAGLLLRIHQLVPDSRQALAARPAAD